MASPDDGGPPDGPGAGPVPPRDLLDRVSGHGVIQILLAASDGPIRFTDLERAVEGVSRRMLTLTLRHLERDGLLERQVHPTVPPEVEYQATPMALELREALLTLTGWARRHGAEVASARRRYDARQSAATST
ncbi:winged helix-turn-helix transcriptional regulator [Nonomuraea rhodomycinica]|uniref:Helix-turn-helix transcriptional regulator n=1 Tax=Nonomuraea rhodomycinica TaxID=1712872 RepID=A0A7Y6IM33_9ACTN|nr:helix-turn-helix domain-containing protein [Nonomuraea rhodomycinica]NUW40777.1 helix-turn-helix transcriptional regulator [Nonomuraea rhodomycinica]